MEFRSLLFATTLLSAAGAASAQSNNPQATPNASFNRGGTVHANFVEAANVRFTSDIEALRKEGLAQQGLDGGTLTPAHRAELQARLDQINAAYRVRIGRSDSLDVNADGSRRNH
jgi:ABC-type oligopeptide transport system substrate-binding subunit